MSERMGSLCSFISVFISQTNDRQSIVILKRKIVKFKIQKNLDNKVGQKTFSSQIFHLIITKNLCVMYYVCILIGI